MISERTPAALVTPAAVVFLGFFALPLGYFLVVSFWRLQLYKLVPDFTFSNYVEAYQQYLSEM